MYISSSAPICPPTFSALRKLNWTKNVLNEFLSSYTKNGDFIEKAELERLSALHKEYHATQRQLEKNTGFFEFKGGAGLCTHVEACGQLRDDMEEAINESLKASVVRKKSVSKIQEQSNDIPIRRDPKTGDIHIGIPNKEIRSDIHDDAASELPGKPKVSPPAKSPTMPTLPSSRTLVNPSAPVAAHPRQMMRGSSSVSPPRQLTSGQFDIDEAVRAALGNFNLDLAQACQNVSGAQRSNPAGSAATWANSIASECQIINGSAESPTYNGRGAKNCSGATTQYAYKGKTLSEESAIGMMTQAHRNATKARRSNTNATTATWARSMSSECQIINGSAASPTYNGKGSQNCTGATTQFAYGNTVLTEEPAEEPSEEK
ncbi:hypothetical protein BJ138DRAFT_1129273 [Hygrophoropsis aurantiaca]|uniref:Uncharacterized protein n=1 Tax=Hygrophoropsis aurantiaca TaxID=72124 RepID=A0ACB8A247_9AGAM|nr:hypothetical protein BJ138DRAFT_1129273 [Hygrophoropsis aurantiaca]